MLGRAGHTDKPKLGPTSVGSSSSSLLVPSNATIQAGVKCAEGMMCIAIFALAMVFTF